MKRIRRRELLQAAAAGAAASAVTAESTFVRAAVQRKTFEISDATKFLVQIGSDVDQIIHFAAEELRKYLQKISSLDLQITSPKSHPISLEHFHLISDRFGVILICCVTTRMSAMR